jgi:peptidoglycan-N-acetylglucosamine deacetylase
MNRICAISIDLDPIPCYYRIHGLGAPPEDLRWLILRRCVPRFAEILARHGIAATFFVVGEDVDEGALGAEARGSRAMLSELVAAGHELGNHSYSHPYDLAKRPQSEIVEEIGRAHALLSEVAGASITGFRAPGYDVSAEMLDELARLGYRYDSSIFPAPAYYAAKSAVMCGMAVLGRKSGAVLTDPKALLAPADPYRPRISSPWRRGQASLVELPIAVTPRLRTPVIGTSLLIAPSWLRARLLTAIRGRPFFNFELHGIDLADAEEDGIPGELVDRQPDLRVPLARKRRAFEATIDRLRLDYRFETLDQVAARVQRGAL